MKKSVLFSLMAVVLLVTAFTFQSCKKDFKDISLSPGLAVPLINGSFTLGDLLPKEDSSFLSKNADNSLKLVYTYKLADKTAEQVIPLDVPSKTEDFPIPTPDIPIPVGITITKTYEDSVQFDFGGGKEIDLIKLKEGLLNITLSSNLKFDAEITMTAPNLKDISDNPYSQTFNLSYPGNTIDNNQGNNDMSGYTMNLNGGWLKYNLTVKMTSTGNPPDGTEKLTFNFSLQNLKFSYIEGYLGQLDLPSYSDSTVLNFFQNTSGGNISLSQPKIDIIISNSFGLPINIKFNTLDAVLPSGLHEALVTPIIDQTIGQPATPSSDSVITTITLDKNNSKLGDVITKSAKKILYSDSIRANPTGVHVKNFVKDKSKISVALNAELPIEGQMKNFAIIDTFRDALKDKIKQEEERISYIQLNLISANTFPFNIKLQLSVTDENFNVIDELIDPSEFLVEAAQPVVVVGQKVVPKTHVLAIKVEGEKIKNLKNGVHLLLKGTLDTYKNDIGEYQDVKLYEDSKLDVRMSMIVQLKNITQ